MDSISMFVDSSTTRKSVKPITICQFSEIVINTLPSETMASQINFNGQQDTEMDVCSPTICIPRVFPNISDKRIFAIFRELRVGFVDHIDMVPQIGKDGKEYNKVFIHFKHWFMNDESACAMRERLLEGEQVKIVYDEPWFWKVHAYAPKQQQQREETRPTPFVDFEFREAPKKRVAVVPPESRRPAHQARTRIATRPQPLNIFSALSASSSEANPESPKTPNAPTTEKNCQLQEPSEQ